MTSAPVCILYTQDPDLVRRLLLLLAHDDPGFGFDIECLYIAQQHGLAIKQTAVSFRYDDEPTTVRFARDSSRMLQDIWQVRTNAWRGQYAAGTPRFVFPPEDQWMPDVHTPPHGIPQSASERPLASA